MCGIVGVWNLDGKPVEPGLVRAMSARIAHRGPDDEGFVAIDPHHAAAPLVMGGPRTSPGVRGADLPYAPPAVDPAPAGESLMLGQSRLSIIDLSPRGHQPMCNEDGTVWITFGGEIYNYIELRESLRGRGHRFRSDADTEVLVHGYEEWGEDLFGHLNGMWGLALWDGRRRRLVVCRDRLGIKPFYYFDDGHTFAFASEIRPLLEVARVRGASIEPNSTAIANLIAYARVDHTEETFFTRIRSLGAGHYAVVQTDGTRLRRYWDLVPEPPPSPAPRWDEELHAALSTAVRLELRADVPVGTCLSGGIDSSSVLALGTHHLGAAMDAYSVAYDEGVAFDERPHMQVAVEATGARHHLVVPDADLLMERLDAVVRAQEEPAAGPGVLSQWHVMELAARNHAKVLLDGQGGDELFAGYVAFHFAPALQDLLAARRCREAGRLARRLAAAGRSPLEILARAIEPWMPAGLYGALSRRFGRRHWHRVLDPSFRRRHLLPPPATPARYGERLNSRLYWDLTRDILPSLLRYEDKNSMAFSIEARVPFLDPDVVELAFRMPGVVKQGRGPSKAVLREAMAGVVPDSILGRTDKRGFETPATQWLRRHHGRELTALLVDGRAVERGILDRGAVAAVSRRFLADRSGGPEHEIWRLLNLELWLRAYFDAAVGEN